MKKEILILGPSPFDKNINHSGGQLTAITNLLKYIDDKNISYDIINIFRSSFPPLSLKDKLIGSWNIYRELKATLNQNSYGGALVFGSDGLGFWEKLFFSLLIEKRGIKTLFFIRSGHFMESVIKKNYYVPIEKFFMNRISYIGYQGGQWGAFYKKMGIVESKLVKVLNWIEIKEYKKTFKNDKITFLYVGWMVEKKGVNDLVDTILENQALKKYKFVFIGGGTLLDSLIEKVNSHGAKNIIFKGWLDSDEVSAYYQSVDALILPSHAEGFPNVILEALNYRLPIIATDVGGISESVIEQYNGFLMKPKDKIKLFNSIQAIGDSLEIRKKFSRNSEDILKKNHTIENNCQIIFDLFKR